MADLLLEDLVKNEEMNFQLEMMNPTIQIQGEETVDRPEIRIDTSYLVPNNMQFRNRSPSIISTSSTAGFSDQFSDYGSDLGEISPFPGTQVVRVPSPWLHAIPSPSMSPLNLSTASFDNFNLDDFQLNSGPTEVQHVPFQEFYNQWNINQDSLFPQSSLPDYTYLSQSFSDQNTFFSKDVNDLFKPEQSSSSLEHSNSIDTLFVPHEDQKPKSSIPDGRFWKTVKENGVTLYQCPWKHDGVCCEKTFTRPYNLKSHYRGHIGEKPYECDVPGCTAAFARKHDLKRHSTLHTDERKFKCKGCGKAFSRNDALVRHLKPSESGKESLCALKVQME